MLLAELAVMATAKGVEDSGTLGKPELIRAIQVAEGNSPCYQSDIAPVCGIEDCLWRAEGCSGQQ
jgi:hypothetical protein